MANEIANPANAGGAVEAIAALRHHRPLAIAALKLIRIAKDASVWPVEFKPSDADAIAEALRLDALVPTDDQLVALRLRIDDATKAPQVTAAELATLLPPLIAARGTVKIENIPAQMAYLMDQVVFERQLHHTTADMVALAVALDLRESRYPPTPAELVERLDAARSMVENLRETYAHLVAVRESIDDLLIGAGLREPADDDALGWS